MAKNRDDSSTRAADPAAAADAPAGLPTAAALGSVPGVRFDPGAAEPVRTVFVHGLLASTSMWKSVAGGPLAASSAALPLPGHYPWSLDPDDTDRAFRDLTFLHLYRDWIDAVADGPVHMVAHSAGSLAAVKFAVLYPEHVKHLTLLGTFADGAAAISASPMARTVVLPIIGGAVFQRLYALWLQSISWFDAGLATVTDSDNAVSQGELSRVERSMLADLRRSDPESLRRVVLWLQRTSVADDLPKVAMPATVFLSKDDPVVSLEKQMAVVRALPNASAVMANVGHLPMFESPELFRLLLDTRPGDSRR
ncbi:MULTISPECIES: alpha/beta hydrolase [unclassified Roseitalea]|uniref:alpha/beta fold hydrolase n=1 Tax=unclassified Roseitalea TaxID=2639107 RepID=UPI00273E01BB|nr:MULTISPECIES: alpha/beta hydrolase [unclassified Roseitalea]